MRACVRAMRARDAAAPTTTSPALLWRKLGAHHRAHRCRCSPFHSTPMMMWHIRERIFGFGFCFVVRCSTKTTLLGSPITQYYREFHTSSSLLSCILYSLVTALFLCLVFGSGPFGQRCLHTGVCWCIGRAVCALCVVCVHLYSHKSVCVCVCVCRIEIMIQPRRWCDVVCAGWSQIKNTHTYVRTTLCAHAPCR